MAHIAHGVLACVEYSVNGVFLYRLPAFQHPLLSSSSTHFFICCSIATVKHFHLVYHNSELFIMFRKKQTEVEAAHGAQGNIYNFMVVFFAALGSFTYGYNSSMQV